MFVDLKFSYIRMEFQGKRKEVSLCVLASVFVTRRGEKPTLASPRLIQPATRTYVMVATACIAWVSMGLSYNPVEHRLR